MTTDYKSGEAGTSDEIGVDTDVVYEPWRTGDPRSVASGHAYEGQDLNQRYCAVQSGATNADVFGYAVEGVDFNQLWAVKNSVPRYPVPLPWDRSVTPTLTFYRQPSRPALRTFMALNVSINRTGGAAITLTASPYNSDPNNPVVSNIFSASNYLWADDDGVSPVCPYEIKVDLQSGAAPDFYQGGPLGQWLPMTASVDTHTFGIVLDYYHGVVPDPIKTLASALDISVRRVTYPTTNTAHAVFNQLLTLTSEPSCFRDDDVWSPSYVISNDATTNYQNPGGTVHTYKSALRFTLTTTRRWQIESAVWKNNETPIWVEVDWGPVLRTPFPLTDFDATFNIVSGAWSADDVTIATGSPLVLGTVDRSFTIQRSVVDSSAPGVYEDDITLLIKLRQVSTSGWAGLPDNTHEAAIRFNPRVVIQAPNLVSWPSLAALDTEFVEFHDVVRNPGGQANLASSLIRVVVRTTGVVQIMNSINFVLATVTWKPASLAMSQLEVRVVCPGAVANPLSNWTTIGVDTVATLTAISRTNEDAVGLYEDVENFFFEVRSKANPSDSNSQESTAVARVEVLNPAPIDWPTMSAIQNTFTQTQNLPYSASGPGSPLTSNIRMNVSHEGGISILNSYNTTLVSDTWKPASLPASNFEVRVICPNAVSNNLANWTTLTMLTQITLVAVSKNQNEAPGTYTDLENFTFEVRNKYNPTDENGVNGVARAEIIITGAANTLVPASDYDDWIGNYTASVSGSI